MMSVTRLEGCAPALCPRSPAPALSRAQSRERARIVVAVSSRMWRGGSVSLLLGAAALVWLIGTLLSTTACTQPAVAVSPTRPRYRPWPTFGWYRRTWPAHPEGSSGGDSAGPRPQTSQRSTASNSGSSRAGAVTAPLVPTARRREGAAAETGGLLTELRTSSSSSSSAHSAAANPPRHRSQPNRDQLQHRPRRGRQSPPAGNQHDTTTATPSTQTGPPRQPRQRHRGTRDRWAPTRQNDRGRRNSNRLRDRSGPCGSHRNIPVTDSSAHPRSPDTEPGKARRPRANGAPPPQPVFRPITGLVWPRWFGCPAPPPPPSRPGSTAPTGPANATAADPASRATPAVPARAD